MPCLRLVGPFALAAFALPAQDWPQWRGPAGDGQIPPQRAELPLSWDAETNVRWKTPLAHKGNGSPIVVGGRVFLTMPEDEEGRGRSLYCFDQRTGEERWHRTVEFERAMPTHQTNPHCSTTPCSDGERVIVWHSSAGLCCYDLDGEKLWRRDLGEFRHQWGHGTSPVLHGDNVVLHTGPGEAPFVAAFDRKTGKTVWRTPEPPHLTAEQIAKKRLAGSWHTPLIQRVGERDLVLCGQPTRLVAYDALTGDIVWHCGGVSSKRGDLTYSSPVVADELCVVFGGYVGPLLGVRITGAGDVTQSERAFLHPETITNCGSGVFENGAIFVPEMGGFVRCLDPEDGSQHWRSRVARGNTWGSILSTGDRLYLMGQNGTTTVFEPSATGLKILATNDLGEDTNSTPAPADGELFLRTHAHLWCICAPDRAK